jgi:hypothetical protein
MLCCFAAVRSAVIVLSTSVIIHVGIPFRFLVGGEFHSNTVEWKFDAVENRITLNGVLRATCDVRRDPYLLTFWNSDRRRYVLARV